MNDDRKTTLFLLLFAIGRAALVCICLGAK